MKVSKLYCNKPELFGPIEFLPGLNVVMAEIRLPENRKKDTHNLGKTTLCRLLDYCFLEGRDPNFFLFKHSDRFEDFVFFLEIELADASYLTVRQGVAEATKISFKKHERVIRIFPRFLKVVGTIWICPSSGRRTCLIACWTGAH